MALGAKSAGSSSMLFAAPPAFSLKCKRPEAVPTQVRLPLRSKSTTETTLGSEQLCRGRSFGLDITNNVLHQSNSNARNNKGKMLPPAVPEARMLKANASVPMQWTSSNEELGECSKNSSLLGVLRTESDPAISGSPLSSLGRDDSAMEVDSPQIRSDFKPGSLMASPALGGPASSSSSPGLGSFFCESPAPPSQAPPGKRRSLVNGPPASPSSGSPSAKRTSLGLGVSRPPLDKTASSSAMLFGGGRANTIASRRGPSYKRPTLGPLAAPSCDDATRTASTNSAFPILYGPPKQTLGQSGTFPRAANAPMRRAYSVCDQNIANEMDDEDSEFENSPCVGAHAEYARRYGARMAPKVDGSPGFKSVRASIAASGEGVVSPLHKGKKTSPYGPGGLPGFGDNEIDGKILPCHKVKEDGLVRITPDTLDELLSGKYSHKIKRYHVLDCRFDYEYDGGHIAGAINVKSMDALDKLLLSEADGIHADGECLPRPSRSGQLEDGQPVVLVFHCEFSAKRAPTFAKHLRSRDRLLNNAIYPKIYYPEVYILEGGYCGFYRTRPERCDPKGYTPMDDPKHFERRDSDLHDFRKFSRTRSFTYGEQQQSSSRALPPCPPLAFAAASAAAARRIGVQGVNTRGNNTIKEEDDQDNSSSPHPGDSSAEMDTDASPCPRAALSLGQPPIFGSAKTRVLGRVGFSRVASYAGTTTIPAPRL